MIAVFFIVYMITFSYIEDRDVHHYIIHTTIDDQIPFCEYFIVPYLLWFISLVFPNGQDLRPVLTGDSIFIKAVQMIYHTDTPTNVLPSIHVFNSLACCVAILKNQRKYKKSTDTACVVLTILIIMSTMFLKQHSVVDVVLAALMYTGCYRIIYGNELWSQNAFRTSIFSDHS